MDHREAKRLLDLRFDDLQLEMVLDQLENSLLLKKQGNLVDVADIVNSNDLNKNAALLQRIK